MSAALSIVNPAANARLEAALEDAQRGLRVVPVHTIRKDGTCSCGRQDCNTPGKHPCIPNWQERATTDPGLLTIWFTHTFKSANVGIITGVKSGVIVLDEDPRNGGDDSLDLMIHRYGRLPDTLTCMTGGGGNHYYFQHPGPPIPNKVALLPGLDVKGDDGLAVAPPSVHESGGTYDWDGMKGFGDPIAQAPDWLLKLILAGAGAEHAGGQTSNRSGAIDGAIPEGERNDRLVSIAGYYQDRGAQQETILGILEAVNAAQCEPPLADREVRAIAKSIARYPCRKEDLEEFPNDFADIPLAVAVLPSAVAPLVAEFQEQYPDIWYRRRPMRVDGWFPYALSIATRCVEAGMSNSQVAAVVAEHRRQHGEDHEPLSVAGFIRLLAKAHTKPARPACGRPEPVPTVAETEAVEPVETEHVPTEPEVETVESNTKQVKPQPTTKAKPKKSKSGDGVVFITNDKGQIRPLLANAELMLRQEWAGVLAYNDFALCVTTVKEPPRFNVPWTGAKVAEAWTDNDDRLAAIWLQRHGVLVSDEVAGKAVQTVARDNRIHPVRAYLDGLTWDGTERLDSWPSTYLGVKPTPYSAAVGARWPVAAVARIYKPGTKADCCLILEGPQGARKSTAIRTLADPWFTDEIAELGSKDAALQARGVWIIELSELDAMSGAEVAKVKSFMSRSTDRFRPPYGRLPIDSPRQCVFAGTVNHSAYLKDETGGRRFWPVACGEIRIEELARDRDQIWAEAVVRYRSGSVWWLESLVLNQLATREQGDRYEGDAWDEIIAAWVERPFARPDEMPFNLPLSSTPESVSIPEVLYHAVGKRTEHWTQADKNRVARSLRSMGWERYRDRTGERLEWRYRKTT